MKRFIVGFALLGACAGTPDPSTDVDTDVDTQDPDTQPPDTDTSDPSDTDPADTDTSDTDLADTDTSDTDLVDTDTSDTDPVDTDPLDTDPVDTDPVDTDPVDTDPLDTDTDTDTDDGIVIPDTDDTDDTDPGDTDDTDPVDTDDTDPVDTDDTDDTDPGDTDDTDPVDTDDTDPVDTDDTDLAPSDCDFVVTFANPSFPSEHGWLIEDLLTADILASQGYPGMSTGAGTFTTTVTLGTGYYTLLQIDAFGDGWNGGTITLENAATGDVVFDAIGFPNPPTTGGPIFLENYFAVDCSDGIDLPLVEDCAGSEHDLIDMLEAIGDGTCDDGAAGFDLTCAEYGFDGGDCGELIEDCDGDDRLLSDVGDGICDAGLFCADFDWDAGDCDAEPLADCDGTEFTAGVIRAALGDGTCDDGTSGPNLDCPSFGNDDGDCRDLVFFDDFDAGCAGWVFGDEWECGSPTSGPSAAFSGADVLATNLDGDYANNRAWDAATATYDGIVLPSEIVEAQFKVWQVFETCCDGFHVSVSTDGGVTFTAAPAINPSYSGTSAGQPAWRRNAPEWNTHVVDLTPWAGQTISLRFAMRSDSSTVRAGAYVDDLEIYALSGGVVDCDGTVLRPESTAVVGDGVCDVSFNCAAFNFDDGDCAPVADPEDCPAGSAADCDDVCFDGFLFDELAGDGDCNDAFGPNLFCGAYGWDEGDCGDLATDCDGNPFPEGFYGNGVCDDALFCYAVGFDDGDCDSEVVLDCSGNATDPVTVLTAAGDGVCDEDPSSLDLNCDAFGFDGGDCLDLLLEEDFDSGCAGWTFGNATWECGVPTSGPGAALSGDSVLATVLAGDYPPNQTFADATATYEGLVLPNAVIEMTFEGWDRMEPSFDGFHVSVSPSGEGAFVPADAVSPTYTHALTGSPAWARNSPQWTTFTVDLTRWAGQTVDVRFAMRSDGSVQFAGAYIDNLVVIASAATEFDCNGVAVSDPVLAEVGDGYCDLRFYCAEYDFDEDDCDPVADPSDCPPAAVADCDNVCFFIGDYNSFLGDGTCDEDLPNLNCAVTNFDDGDCADIITDCNGDVVLESTLGDGTCDENLLCAERNWDEGDCDAEPAEDCDGAEITIGDVRAAYGDGTCDDGSGGVNLFCEEFDNDGGDCVVAVLFDDMSDCGLWTLGTEWQCGAPTSGPGAAFTGTNVIATNLGGNYAANRTFDTAHATRDAVALPLGEVLELRFRSWFHLDLFSGALWDTYRVEVSTDGGATFEVAPPITPGHAAVGGLPSEQAYGPPATSGGVFVQKRVDLSQYGGQDVLIRFAFHSDTIDQFAGAYIDALEVVSFGAADVLDCDGAAVTGDALDALGDGICDARFNCPALDADEGDCEPVADPEAANACPSGASLDCDSVCFANSVLNARRGNGTCNDAGSPNLFCLAQDWDEGDCGPVTTDCDGDAIPEAFIGDGTCEASTICGALDFGAGDCDGETVVDCDGAVVSVGTVRAAYGDGTCDDAGGLNLDCELFERDGGDCTALVLEEDFDSGCGDWVFGSEWECGVPTSGPGAALSGDSVLATNLAANYANGRGWDATHATYEGLVLPLAELELEFRAWYNFEGGDTSTNWDGFHVSVSTDGGASFTAVSGVNPPYNGTSGSRPSWSGIFEQWRTMRVDLTPFAGQTIDLRLAMYSDGSVNRPGAYIDNLTIRSFGAAIVGCDGVTTIPEAALGDGFCDEELFCAAFDDDDGDCILACDEVTPVDSAALGDGVCDPALACEDYAFDDGDCILACDEVTPVDASSLGDGVCNADLNCEDYNFDEGDCTCSFVVDLTVGAFAGDYGWEVFNSSGALVATSGNTPASPGGGPGPTVTEVFVGLGGIYTFVAHDSWGDGWVDFSGNPDGFFSLFQDGSPISLLDESGQPLLDSSGDPITEGTVDDQGLSSTRISQTYQFVVDCSPCPAGEDLDCNDVCFPTGVIDDALNNGICDDGDPPAINLACEAYNFDNFTCDVPSDCEEGEEPDCDGNCFVDLVALLGDGVCHDGTSGEPNLLCEEYFFDFDDCDFVD